MSEKKCKRCGRCCYFPDPDGHWHKCRYLKQEIKTNLTHCVRYENRLGTHVGYGWICSMDSPFNIPDCPFNEKDKPKHPYWSKQKSLR